jgi:peptidoglycan/LPS O-acetylase OafA/YrhL
VRSIDGAYWSLFVEIQFYAMVAVLIVFGRIHQAQQVLVLWLAATVALSFYRVGVLRTALITDFAALFIAGATYYLIWARGVSSLRVAILAVCWLITVIEEISHSPLAKTGVDYSKWVIAAYITGFFLVMFLVAIRRTGRLMNRQWRLAGALTYPLYLIHQNIGYIVFYHAHEWVNATLLLICVLLLALFISYLVHIKVENPMGRVLKRFLSEWFERASRMFARTERETP